MQRWYKKVFFHLVDVALINAKVVIQHHPDFQFMKHSDFRTKLVEDILTKYPQAKQNVSQIPIGDDSNRLTARHVKISKVDNTKRRTCKVCASSKIRKDCTTYCEPCGTFLCIAHWDTFHKQVIY
jgi:hypothetical protein